jgi:hypothetical protein
MGPRSSSAATASDARICFSSRVMHISQGICLYRPPDSNHSTLESYSGFHAMFRLPIILLILPSSDITFVKHDRNYVLISGCQSGHLQMVGNDMERGYFGRTFPTVVLLLEPRVRVRIVNRTYPSIGSFGKQMAINMPLHPLSRFRESLRLQKILRFPFGQDVRINQTFLKCTIPRKEGKVPLHIFVSGKQSINRFQYCKATPDR